MIILNASPELTEDQTKNFLGKSKLNIHIVTIDSKGDPNIHPTWYYFDVLPTNKLVFYLRQDHYFLEEFSRFLNSAKQKTSDNKLK